MLDELRMPDQPASHLKSSCCQLCEQNNIAKIADGALGVTWEP
jgi:hypothetical protein